MTECDYCDESLDGEDDYIEHLSTVHDKDELGKIDQRRVDRIETDGDGLLAGRSFLIIIGTVLLFGLVIGIGVTLIATDNPLDDGANLAGTVDVHPTNPGSVDDTAEVTVVVDGEEFEWEERHVERDDHAAFHATDGVVHITSEHVTVEYFLATVGMELDDGQFYYAEGDIEGDVAVTANGDDVDPHTYTISDGDDIRVEVSTD